MRIFLARYGTSRAQCHRCFATRLPAPHQSTLGAIVLGSCFGHKIANFVVAGSGLLQRVLETDNTSPNVQQFTLQTSALGSSQC
jgi:hypothetical protein